MLSSVFGWSDGELEIQMYDGSTQVWSAKTVLCFFPSLLRNEDDEADCFWVSQVTGTWAPVNIFICKLIGGKPA